MQIKKVATFSVLLALCAALMSPMHVQAEAGYTWTQRTNSTQKYWDLVSMSADGMKIVALGHTGNAYYNASTGTYYLYVSTDAGVTWTQRRGPVGGSDITGPAYAPDGSKIYFPEEYTNYTTNVFVSNDDGVSWTGTGSFSGQTDTPVQTSYTGSTVMTSVYGYTSPDTLRISNNGASSWQTSTCPSGKCTYVAVSNDGQKMTAFYFNDIRTSTNGGVSWTSRTVTNMTKQHIGAIAVSPGGDIIYASEGEFTGPEGDIWESGYLFRSIDQGATWTRLTGAGVGWSVLAMSTDGLNLVGGTDTNSYIYTSSDGGNTWIQQTSAGAREWGDVTVSADGTKIVAVDSEEWAYVSTGVTGGYIWTATSNTAPAQPTITASATGYVGQAVTVTLSGANDPEDNTIRYAIDWDSNGTVDGYAPVSGDYIPDTSPAQTAEKTWGEPGVKTYQARSEDSQGGVSAWVQKTITISAAPDALLTATAASYREGDAALTLTWSSSDATSCTGTNFDTDGATSGSVRVTPTATTEYTLTCTNPGGSDIDSEIVTYTANQAPNKPTITGPTTGRTGATYAYTITGTTPADPEGDPVRIGLDYNGDDIVDVWSEEW